MVERIFQKNLLPIRNRFCLRGSKKTYDGVSVLPGSNRFGIYRDRGMDRSQSRLSLAQQWLLIATVALVPLLAVAAYATWSLYQQMHKQRLIVQRVDLVSHVQSAVVDQMRELERSVRQYRLLRDPRFLDLYQQKRESFRQAKIELKMLVPEIQTFETNAVAQQQHPLEKAVQLLDEVSDVIDDITLDELQDEEFSEVLARISQARIEFDQEIAVHTHRLTDDVERDLQAILWRLSLMGLITLPTSSTAR
jgi:two-component system, NtrC family, sensor histidine kinase GlrK